MGVSGQRHVPAALYPEKRTLVHIGQEAGWASELVWTQRLEENSFASAGDRTPVVQCTQATHANYAIGCFSLCLALSTVRLYTGHLQQQNVALFQLTIVSILTIHK
jgi:hypothetical protein